LKQKIKDNLFSNVFSLCLGGIITAFFFFFSSHPVGPEEVKEELLVTSLDEITKRYGGVASESSIDKLASAGLEVGAEKSIIVAGSVKIDDGQYRWVSIFERSPPGLIDKLVGRPGFFELKSLTSYEAPSFNSLLVDGIEIKDFDGNGTSEIHVRLESVWADSTSVGPIIFTKKEDTQWSMNAVPPISDAINETVKNPEMGGRRPYTFFGMVGDGDPSPKSIDELRQLDISEETWIVNHNGVEKSFTTLRNGGDYTFRTHPVKGYSQIQTLSFFRDGGAVLGPHYAVVNMFKFGEAGLETDDLWNWEYPMYSTRPLRLLDIDLDSISEAGIQAHVAGDVFYGYTEFEKIRVQK